MPNFGLFICIHPPYALALHLKFDYAPKTQRLNSLYEAWENRRREEDEK